MDIITYLVWFLRKQSQSVKSHTQFLTHGNYTSLSDDLGNQDRKMGRTKKERTYILILVAEEAGIVLSLNGYV